MIYRFVSGAPGSFAIALLSAAGAVACGDSDEAGGADPGAGFERSGGSNQAVLRELPDECRPAYSNVTAASVTRVSVNIEGDNYFTPLYADSEYLYSLEVVRTAAFRKAVSRLSIAKGGTPELLWDDSSVSPTDIAGAGDTLYVASRDGIFRVSTADGTAELFIDESARKVSLTNGALYFFQTQSETQEDTLYRADLTSKAVTLIAPLDGVDEVFSNAGYLYFNRMGQTHRMPEAGGPIEDVAKAIAIDAVVSGDYVYAKLDVSLGRAPKAGGALEAFLPAGVPPSCLQMYNSPVANEDTVFFSGPNGVKVYSPAQDSLELLQISPFPPSRLEASLLGTQLFGSQLVLTNDDEVWVVATP